MNSLVIHLLYINLIGPFKQSWYNCVCFTEFVEQIISRISNDMTKYLCLLHLPIYKDFTPSIADTTRVDSTMDSSDFTTDPITTGHPTGTTSQCPHGRDPSTNCTKCFTGRDPSTDCVACLPGMYQPSDRATECVTVPGIISEDKCMSE